MKTVLFIALILLAIPVFGQGTAYTVAPPVSTTEIDSIVTDSTSTTVYSVTKPFTGITAGMPVVGIRIPLGTKVVSNTNDSILVLSNKPTATVALDSMRFAKYTASQQYTAGDAMGFPFAVPLQTINSIVVEDDIKQITSVKLLFFRDDFVATEDNLAFAVSDADAKKIVGAVLVDSNLVFANNHLMYMPHSLNEFYLGNSRKMWCQMIAVGTPTFTAVDAVRVTLIGK